MLGPFTVDTIFPGFPAVQREFTVDAVATQQIVSVYLFTFAVMSLLHGPLSDALGRRPVIVGGLAMFTVTSVLCALAPSMTWLLVGRALQGVFAGGGMIVGRTVVRDVFSGHPAQRAMSQMSMIFGVAPALAPIVGGWLLGWSSWRSIFWFLAIFAVVVLAAVMLLLPETHPPTRRTPLSTRALVSAVTDSSKDPSVRRLLLVSSFNFAALFDFSSHFGAEQHGAVTALVLALIERDIGVAHQFLRRAAMIRRLGDADRRRNLDRLLTESERWANRGQQAVGNLGQIACRGCFGDRQQQTELVAAEAGNDVRFAHAVGEAPAEFDQQAVGEVRPEPAVDGFEVIDVEVDDRQSVSTLSGAAH